MAGPSPAMTTGPKPRFLVWSEATLGSSPRACAAIPIAVRNGMGIASPGLHQGRNDSDKDPQVFTRSDIDHSDGVSQVRI